MTLTHFVSYCKKSYHLEDPGSLSLPKGFDAYNVVGCLEEPSPNGGAQFGNVVEDDEACSEAKRNDLESQCSVVTIEIIKVTLFCIGSGAQRESGTTPCIRDPSPRVMTPHFLRRSGGDPFW